MKYKWLNENYLDVVYAAFRNSNILYMIEDILFLLHALFNVKTILVKMSFDHLLKGTS